jgi:hypothetical protein
LVSALKLEIINKKKKNDENIFSVQCKLFSFFRFHSFPEHMENSSSYEKFKERFWPFTVCIKVFDDRFDESCLTKFKSRVSVVYFPIYAESLQHGLLALVSRLA